MHTFLYQCTENARAMKFLTIVLFEWFHNKADNSQFSDLYFYTQDILYSVPVIWFITVCACDVMQGIKVLGIFILLEYLIPQERSQITVSYLIIYQFIQ